MAIQSKKIFSFFYIVMGMTFFTYCLLPFLPKSLHDFLFLEDFVLENLSAILYLWGSGLALYLLFNKKQDHFRWASLIIFMLAMICFLDEISFGERLFGFKMPHIGEVKIDAVHDLLYVAYHFLIDNFTKKQLLPAFLILAIGFGIVVFKFRGYIKASLVQCKALHLVIWVVGLIGLASIFDLDIFSCHFLSYLEEACELSGAWALFCAAYMKCEDE